MKKIILFFHMILFLSCNAQEKEIVYVIIESNQDIECEVSMYRDFSNKQKIKSRFTKKGILGKESIQFVV